MSVPPEPAQVLAATEVRFRAPAEVRASVPLVAVEIVMFCKVLVMAKAPPECVHVDAAAEVWFTAPADVRARVPDVTVEMVTF